MNEPQCHRCASVLHVESEGALVYCWHCGAPQILLSEELQDQAAERARRERDRTEQDLHLPRSSGASGAIDWKLTIRLALLVSGVLAALSIVLPPLGVLVFAWAPVAPAVVISLYAARGRLASFTAGSGARVGLICGSFIALALAVLNTLALVFLRFVFHRSDFDASVNGTLTQVRAQIAAQYGAPATDIFNLFGVPEFRAGFFLTGFALLTIFVLLLATGGGAIAGSFQKRKRTS